MSEQDHSTHPLIIAGINILQDSHGRYNLNTLHNASGALASKEPNQWLRRRSTKELISELSSMPSDLQVDVVKGGNAAGVYVHEVLAVSYAGWISPAFQIKVNQAFIDSRRNITSLPKLHDPSLQAILSLTVDLDATKYRLAQVEQDNLRIEAKADAAVQNQNFWTVAEYVQYHDLKRQCPEPAYAEASRHMQSYCQRERLNYRDPNILPRRIPVGGKNWETEWGFHTSVYEKAFLPWLTRREGQGTLLTLKRKAD